MTSLRNRGGLILASLTIAALLGCEESAPQTQAPPPPRPVAAPPPPPPPRVATVAELMERLNIDERIVLEEDKAPTDEAERVAVLEFFDAFVRGDVGSLSSMLSVIDKQELEALAATDAWDETVSGIREILVETGAGPTGESCALAIFDVRGEDQPQLWYYTTSADALNTNGYLFDAAATPPNIIDQLHGDDWIARWHEILEEEVQLAIKPDEDIAPLNVDIDDSEDEDEDFSGGGGGGTSPGFAPSGSPNGRRKPIGAPGGRPPGPGSP